MIQDFVEIEKNLFAAQVPAQTKSYSPVSHLNIVEAISEEADKRGLEIKSKQYWTAKDNQQVTGKFNIVVPGEDEVGMMTAFRNSYDRSMSLGFAAGGNVWICTNGMVGGDITLVRRHTGSIMNEISDKIVTSMDQLEDEFNKLLKQKELMKQIEMSKQASAELAGRLFIEEELITATQLGTFKRELIGKGTNNFQDENVWCTYNNITEALKKSSAYSYIDNHIQIHNFFEKEFSGILDI